MYLDVAATQDSVRANGEWAQIRSFWDTMADHEQYQGISRDAFSRLEYRPKKRRKTLVSGPRREIFFYEPIFDETSNIKTS